MLWAELCIPSPSPPSQIHSVPQTITDTEAKEVIQLKWEDEGRSYSDMTGVLARREDQDTNTCGRWRPCEHEDGPLPAKERGFRRKQTCWHLGLGFPASKLSEINALFQPPSLWCLVMPTLENGYSVFSTFFFLPFKLRAEHFAVVIFTPSQPGLIFLFKLPARFIEKLVKKGEQFKLISL